MVLFHAPGIKNEERVRGKGLWQLTLVGSLPGTDSLPRALSCHLYLVIQKQVTLAAKESGEMNIFNGISYSPK